MNFLRQEEPAGVPHISIKLLQLFGVTGRPEERLRILPVMLTYFFFIVVPKCFFGYPDLEITIIGTAELIFQSNTFCGMFLLFLNRHKLAQFITHVRTFSLTVLRESPPAVVQHLTTQHDFIHKITRIYCIVVMFAAHFYVLTPLLSTLYAFYGNVRNDNVTVHYTLQMEENFYGLQTRTTTSHYLLFGMIMTPTIYLCAFTGTVKILSICNITMYCTLYFQLVQLKLRTVTQDNTFNRQEVKSIVVMHQDALNCASLVESITSLVLLQQLLLCVMIWSSMLLYFTVSGFDLNFINLLVLFAFDTTETFAYCYFGEQLSNESARVAHTVYDSGWETQTPDVQKDLQLILARAQRPVGITAGKFCYMNMEQLGIIVKTTYSIYVILRDQF